MHIEKTNTSYLLFIEPTPKSTSPIIDIYTRKMTGAFRNAKKGIATYRYGEPYFFISESGWKGIHICECENNATSSNQDYLIMTKDSLVSSFLGKDARTGSSEGAVPIQAVITNSLCIHYVACHRDSISPEVLQSILLLEGDEAEPTTSEIQSVREKVL